MPKRLKNGLTRQQEKNRLAKLRAWHKHKRDRKEARLRRAEERKQYQGAVMHADAAVGKSYGQMAVTDRKHPDQLWKLSKKTRRQLAAHLDEAHNAGHTEAMKWHSGVDGEKNERIKLLQAERAELLSKSRSWRILAELLMEKHGYRLDHT